ncbi:MAG: DUF58 domain-containing protein [Bacteroidales bacterium]|nr:DUF58 domain-containing protein [Bacteroidales bacterium]MBN2755609.1 DUF58 domain-containing protein [Bacteroidales bacterium]
MELLARQLVEGFITGLHKSPFHGFSAEFSEHRIYNKGESTRHIDWKLFARTDKFFIKRYEEETNLRCRILIDVSSSMLFPFEKNSIQNKLAFSAYTASAIIYLLQKQRDAVGLTFFSDNIELHTESKSSTIHLKYLYQELNKILKKENYQLEKNTSISDVLHEIAEKIHKRSLVIIFSDMISDANFDEVFSALQHLRYNKHEVILYHVVDKSLEIDLEYSNRPYKFVDLESGRTLKLNPNEVRDLFKKKSTQVFEELQLKCAQYKIDLVEADIKADFKEVLIPYLLKRQSLY